MRTLKLSALVSALTVGAAVFAVSAQTVVAPYAPTDSGQVIVVQPPPSAVIVESPALVPAQPPMVQPDPSADTKCQFAAPNAYWDCVNSHNGSGGG